MDTTFDDAAVTTAAATSAASAATSTFRDARHLMEDVAERLRDSLARTETDLAALLHLNERAESERDELRSHLEEVAAARDEALSRVAERDASIERLTVELRHARDIASDALVGKAKDQLAIAGKDAQLVDLRQQLERQVATSAAESDKRLAAEMELVGATTARDNFASEIADLRARLDALSGIGAAVNTPRA
jgi:chromosome segregation ATPase